MVCLPGSTLLEHMTFDFSPRLPARFMKAVLNCRVQALVNDKVVSERVLGTLPAENRRVLFPINWPVKAGDVVLGRLLSVGLRAPACGLTIQASVSVRGELRFPPSKRLPPERVVKPNF